METLLQNPRFFKPLNHVITITGEKAAQLLHGQLTNSIKDLPLDRGNYNLLLNIKGKIQADLYVINRGNHLQILVPEEFSKMVFDHLLKLASLSRCNLIDVTSQFDVYHILGTLPENLPALELYQGQLFEDTYLFRSDRLGTKGYDVIVGTGRDLSSLGNFQELTASETELLRIKSGIARVGIDATEKNLPQEAKLDNTLHFNKGCYLGQEIIARLHFKGHVNKILTALQSNEKDFAVHDEIKDGEQVVGEITSVAFDSNENKTYLLGYLPVSKVEVGKSFAVGEKTISIVQ